jgi:hypothetical protein
MGQLAREACCVEHPTAWDGGVRRRRYGSQGPASEKPKNPNDLPDWGLILGSAAPSRAAKRS